MVGGGLSVGHTILETAQKEAMEEASINSELLKKLTSAGCVSYVNAIFLILCFELYPILCPTLVY